MNGTIHHASRRHLPSVLLNRVVQHLESMPQSERRRWLELLSYITALVYHVREPSEWPDLQRTIDVSLQTDEHRQEIFEMRRTIAADELEEQGAIKKTQQTLIRLLNRRFGDVPDDLSSTIRATTDPKQLDEWLDRFATAKTLEEVGVEVPAQR